jgi:hypothetical protein
MTAPNARDGGAQMARLIGIGGGTGIGSIVYGLVRAAKLLDEPALLSDASRIARLIDTEQIATDRHHDVLQGAAGAILGLLALHLAGVTRWRWPRRTVAANICCVGGLSIATATRDGAR